MFRAESIAFLVEEWNLDSADICLSVNVNTCIFKKRQSINLKTFISFCKLSVARPSPVTSIRIDHVVLRCITIGAAFCLRCPHSERAY